VSSVTAALLGANLVTCAKVVNFFSHFAKMFSGTKLQLRQSVLSFLLRLLIRGF
jgi:hypothetical protein